MMRWALLFLLLSGCLRPAEERTRRDLQIGQATSLMFDVRVASGLAAVRKLTSDELALWISAPSIELEIVAREAMTLRFSVENAMPAAELSSNDRAQFTPLESGTSLKRRAWRLELLPGTSRFRLAPPDAAQPGTFRFGLLSDVQEAIDRVQDIYRVVNRQPDLDFLLGAGDLTDEGEVEELLRFQYELEDLALPYYTTLGNHELDESSVPGYQDWFGRMNFQFVHRGVYFTLIDSASASIDPLAYEWLDDWLAKGRNAMHIVAMHIPPLDPIGTRNASFASRAEAAALIGKLAAAGVDLTLYGHIHSLYSFENGGIPAFISGGGGATPEHADDIGRHFLVLEVDAKRGLLDSRVVRVERADDE